jgi:hypothetical protein
MRGVDMKGFIQLPLLLQKLGVTAAVVASEKHKDRTTWK